MNLLTKSRYSHESTAPRGYDDTLIEVAAELVDSVVQYTTQAGSTDSWVLAYPNV